MVDTSQIRDHMEVIGADGVHVGTVDHVDGDRIKLASPLTFTDGHVGEEFIVVKRGRRLSFRDPETRIGYAISRFMQREWTIVPVTKVHKTIFA